MIPNYRKFVSPLLIKYMPALCHLDFKKGKVDMLSAYDLKSIFTVFTKLPGSPTSNPTDKFYYEVTFENYSAFVSNHTEIPRGL